MVVVVDFRRTARYMASIMVAQPGRSTQCRLHCSCCIPQRVHLTWQWSMACPGLATHTLVGLCALWLASAASSSGNLHKPGKTQPPQNTCGPALWQPPVPAQPHLLRPAKPAFDPTVPHGRPRAGHSHTGRALYAVVAECYLLVWKSP